MVAAKTAVKDLPKAAKVLKRGSSSSAAVSHASNDEGSNNDAKILRARKQQIEDDQAFAFSLAADDTPAEEGDHASASSSLRRTLPSHREEDLHYELPSDDDDMLPSSAAEVVKRVRTQEKAKFRLGQRHHDPYSNTSAASSSTPIAVQRATTSSSRNPKRRFEAIDDDEGSGLASNKKAKGKGRAKHSVIDLTVDVIDLDSD